MAWTCIQIKSDTLIVGFCMIPNIACVAGNTYQPHTHILNSKQNCSTLTWEKLNRQWDPTSPSWWFYPVGLILPKTTWATLPDNFQRMEESHMQQTTKIYCRRGVANFNEKSRYIYYWLWRLVCGDHHMSWHRLHTDRKGQICVTLRFVLLADEEGSNYRPYPTHLVNQHYCSLGIGT